MKKIILILFLFLTIFSCYIIYELTDNDNLYLTYIGDNTVNNLDLKEITNISTYNNYFVNNDYRIIDLLNIIKYNEEIEINNKLISIHQILKKSDIIILSVGMNDIYQKLNSDTKDIYTYSNDMINNMELILDEIDRYDHQKVYLLGYYNPTNKHDDIYTYINYKLKRISANHNFIYLDLNSIFRNNSKYYQKNDNFYLNNQGKKEIIKLIVENFKNY